MNNKLLVCHGEGIGNAVQIVPLLRTLKDVLGYNIDYWHVYGSYLLPRDLFPYVNKMFCGAEISKAHAPNYFGMVSTYWARDYIKNLPLKLLSTIYPLSMDRSEVDTYMQIARDLGVKDENLKWEASCHYNKTEQTTFDIVISNGYNKQSKVWEVKGYEYFDKVVDILKEKGYNICSIGSPEEYVKGTVNMTWKPLLDSMALIKNSKLLLSTDTGMYHAANALQTDNVVLFTATSTVKNYDPRFHKHTTIIGRDDLKCRPCQVNRRWLKDCKNWVCREIDPEYVANIVMEVLI